MLRLSAHSISLLLKCLENHKPNLIWIITNTEYIDIDENLGDDLRDAICDELTEYGFDDCTPNKYGLSLENLIDEVGRLYIR